jgi:hypothetical protein
VSLSLQIGQLAPVSGAGVHVPQRKQKMLYLISICLCACKQQLQQLRLALCCHEPARNLLPALGRLRLSVAARALPGMPLQACCRTVAGYSMAPRSSACELTKPAASQEGRGLVWWLSLAHNAPAQHVGSLMSNHGLSRLTRFLLLLLWMLHEKAEADVGCHQAGKCCATAFVRCHCCQQAASTVAVLFQLTAGACHHVGRTHHLR